MPSLVIPDEIINGIWRSVAYLDHPVEWFLPTELPAKLAALNASRQIKVRRKPRRGPLFGYMIRVEDPYYQRALVLAVDRLVIDNGGVVSRFDLAADLCTWQPWPLRRTLKNRNHQLHLRHSRGQRTWKRSTYLTRWRKARRRPPRNGILYVRNSKLIRHTSGVGYPCVHYELRATRRFIRRESLASMSEVLTRYSDLLQRNIVLRDHRNRLHPLPPVLLPTSFAFAHSKYTATDNYPRLTPIPPAQLAPRISSHFHPHRIPLPRRFAPSQTHPRNRLQPRR
jgi:hypothetical protein